MAQTRPICITVIILFHVASAVLWVFGQTMAVLDYDQAAAWGLQDPRDLLDPVIVEVNRAIGLTDTLVMIPLHVLAAIGLWGLRWYGAVLSWMVFGMTIYWPLIFITSQYFYAEAGIQHAPAPLAFILTPAAIFVFACWASWYLARHRALFVRLSHHSATA